MAFIGDEPSRNRDQRPTVDWEQRLGGQLRALRIAAQLDQRGLAELAGVSIGSIKNLEQGNGSSLKTLVRVSGALGQEGWLGSLSPAISVSPIDLVRSGKRERKRVYRRRANES